MEERYIRNIPALTEAECSLLQKKRILVAGCGGLGGTLIELMLRLGIGEIVAVDGDVFEPSNLNRQLLSEVSLLGTSKAQAAAARAARVNPQVHVQPVQVFIDETNADALVQGCDVVLDALDNVVSRRILARACADAGIPFVHGAIYGWVAQAAISMPEDRLVEKIYPEKEIPTDKSVLAFAPALCASMQASLCTQLLCGRPIRTGVLYCFDLLNMELESLSFG